MEFRQAGKRALKRTKFKYYRFFWPSIASSRAKQDKVKL
jgi:hypothetical protein